MTSHALSPKLNIHRCENFVRHTVGISSYGTYCTNSSPSYCSNKQAIDKDVTYLDPRRGQNKGTTVGMLLFNKGVGGRWWSIFGSRILLLGVTWPGRMLGDLRRRVFTTLNKTSMLVCKKARDFPKYVRWAATYQFVSSSLYLCTNVRWTCRQSYPRM